MELGSAFIDLWYLLMRDLVGFVASGGGEGCRRRPDDKMELGQFNTFLQSVIVCEIFSRKFANTESHQAVSVSVRIVVWWRRRLQRWIIERGETTFFAQNKKLWCFTFCDKKFGFFIILYHQLLSVVSH